MLFIGRKNDVTVKIKLFKHSKLFLEIRTDPLDNFVVILLGCIFNLPCSSTEKEISHFTLCKFPLKNTSTSIRYQIHMPVFPGHRRVNLNILQKQKRARKCCFEKQFLSTNAAVNIFYNTFFLPLWSMKMQI